MRGGSICTALAISLVAHAVLLFWLSNRNFADSSALAVRHANRFQGLPPMRVQKFDGDPLARTPQRGGENRPAPAADADDAGHVDRLKAPERSPEAPPAAAAAAIAQEAPAAPKVDADEWRPRQDISTVEAEIADDARAVIPRRVVAKIERVKIAEDIVPAADLVMGESPAPAVVPAQPSPGSAALPASLGIGGAAGEDRFGFAAPPDTPPAPKRPDAPALVPSSAIRDSVDEFAVALERRAVEDLRDGREALPLEGVDVRLESWSDPAAGRRYFRVSLEPRDTLPVIPKDVVYLVDASGSVSPVFREATRAVSKMLRSLGEGDRFNIIFFRNRFKPVFSGWREIDHDAFLAADRCLRDETAHGTTDVFASLEGVLRMPRDPKRPIVAVMVSDGKPEGRDIAIRRAADILSKFSALNGGIVSVCFYGVVPDADAYLVGMIAAGNRGVAEIRRGRAPLEEGMLAFDARYSRPVLSDLAVTFSAAARADAYPRLPPNLCLGGRVEIFGSCPADSKELVFSVKGLAAGVPREALYTLSFDEGFKGDSRLRSEWARQRLHEMVAEYSASPSPELMDAMRRFSGAYAVPIPYLKALEGK